ncbi:exopolygalacturonase-like [Hordeum vulgare subsp. vulgare]|uniref:Exopolygalacturonase n=1 Tax=Hordeum vulgare subsp. vulgare TaxID=112509 RepID=A0A8I6Z724_HORVV|nr:exopolygalacturonase-like [Hordeum vulgare subsp. vulgare]
MAFRNVAMRVLLLMVVVSAAYAKGKEEKKESADGPAASGPAASGPGGEYDITKLGAKPDGKTDSTKAVEEAWASACGGTGKQTIVIPKGDFLTGALNFTGPCKGDSVTIKLEGNLLASNDLSKFPSNWIEIMRIKNLVITGKGSIDGQGKAVWTKNSCQKNYNCKILPNSLVLDFCDDALIEGISIINSKFFHMNIYECKGVTVKDVKVSAPGDSPNTDGIHMGDSSNVNIIDTTIAVGDDCISIGPGSKQVNISGVTCGPGHGISIGSLGRYKDEKDVTDIHVKNCVFKGSTNGLRIKSYEDSKSPLVASKISYENIKMDDSGYPIIIDQKYCPNKLCTAKGDSSRVTVKDVTFKNITGTSSTPEAVSLLCSDKKPCEGVTMSDVKIEYSGKNNKTMAVCTNVKVTATGVDKANACAA